PRLARGDRGGLRGGVSRRSPAPPEGEVSMPRHGWPHAPTALATALIGLLVPAARLAAEQAMPATEIPVCTTELYKKWADDRANTLGVRLTDTSPYVLPSARAGDSCDGPVDFSADQDGRARDGIHGWVAASRCRETLCWEPRDFEPNLQTTALSA